QAGAVAISLTVGADRQLAIVVRDDGRGFDTARVKPELGLHSIDDRVDQVGGTWQIASAPGQGTTLSVRLPLPHDPEPRIATIASAESAFLLRNATAPTASARDG